MIDPKIQEYSDRNTSAESPLLAEIRERTMAERDDKSMLSGFYQGRLLSILSKMVRPRRVLEIGTYMGYSALCLAEGLADDGRVITLDVEPETHEIAKGYWSRSALGAKIDGRLGDALAIIPELDETFDLVFIDADKPNYGAYYDLAMPRLRRGGVILADNVLWSGKVLDTAANSDPNTLALAEFSCKVTADAATSNVLLTVRDGLMIIVKETD